MRKVLALSTFLVYSFTGLAQNPEIKADIPTIMPPSPTVAALMKFEEIPVSNYTGVPDISIPLYSSPTRSKDINLDISLKYHPAGITAEERASDTGLGWSLFAGGSISRTVRGYPDEYQKPGDFRRGIYVPTNTYYQVMAMMGGTTSWVQNTISEFMWETNEKGKYDSEHDLWQFDFMGYSGRFYIKKNAAGVLEVVKLDNDNSIKIPILIRL